MKSLTQHLKLGIYNKACKLVFIIVKPGSLDYKQTIIERMEEFGWHLSMSKPKKLLLSEAKTLYDIHKKEEWYDSLCKYMSSDISIGMIFTKPGISGNVDFKEVSDIKDQIRKEFGESDMRNIMHSSDSMKHMRHEASVYFGIF